MTEQSLKRKKIASLIALILFVVVMGTLTVVFSRQISAFFREPERLRDWVAKHGVASRLAFLGVVIVQVVIALIPGEPVEIAAGVLFGVWEGTLICLIGAAVGSCLVFLAVRKWGVKVVELFFPAKEHHKLKFMREEKRAEILLFLLLFIPGTPKDLVSYFAGLTPVKFIHFAWITLVARIPSVVTSTWGGDAILAGNWLLTVLIFTGTGAVSLLGIWAYNRITARRAAKKAKADGEAEEKRAPEPAYSTVTHKGEDDA